jgi:hypothetical protein
MKNLHSIGWNYRDVASSESRSFHSYGIAVDILMKTEAVKEKPTGNGLRPRGLTGVLSPLKRDKTNLPQ